MNFSPLDYTNYNALAFIFGFGLPVILMIAFMVFIEKQRNKKQFNDAIELKLFGAGMIGLIVLALVGVFAGENHVVNVLKDNQFKATQNIIQKYEVKDVRWDSQQTTASPVLAADKDGKTNNEIVILAKNGKSYVFLYELNKETSEPTLKDMPISGGSNIEDSTDAESLLKTTK